MAIGCRTVRKETHAATTSDVAQAYHAALKLPVYETIYPVTIGAVSTNGITAC